jgi:hypothetical protein
VIKYRKLYIASPFTTLWVYMDESDELEELLRSLEAKRQAERPGLEERLCLLREFPHGLGIRDGEHGFQYNIVAAEDGNEVRLLAARPYHNGWCDIAVRIASRSHVEQYRGGIGLFNQKIADEFYKRIAMDRNCLIQSADMCGELLQYYSKGIVFLEHDLLPDGYAHIISKDGFIFLAHRRFAFKAGEGRYELANNTGVVREGFMTPLALYSALKRRLDEHQQYLEFNELKERRSAA